MPEPERVSFFSNDLTHAREANLALNAPISPDGVIQVGLPKAIMQAAPKTELHILGNKQSVTLTRTDGKPLEVEWVHVDDFAGTKTRLSILKEPTEEVVFERKGMKKTDGDWACEWHADGIVSGELAVELARAIGNSCLPKLKKS